MVNLEYLLALMAWVRQTCKARAAVGKGEKSLLCDPGSELKLLGGKQEQEQGEDTTINGMQK